MGKSQSTNARPADGPAVWEVDLRSGVATYTQCLAALIGCSGERLGHDVHGLARCLEADDARRHEDTIARILSSGATQDTCPLTVACGAGAPLRVIETLFLVREGGEPRVLLGVLRVDGHDAAAPSLAVRVDESRRLFETFVDSLPQLAWTSDPEGWISYYNRRWYEYTGKTFAEMKGWGWVSVHDPNDLPRMLRIWRNALETGEPWEDEFRLRRGSDGMLRWHLSRAMPVRDDAGRIYRWFGTNTDVHDQKLAAEEYSRLLAREEHARREAEAANRAKDEFLAVVSHELRTPLNVILSWAEMLARGTLPAEKVVRGVVKIKENAKRQAKLVEDLLDVSRIATGKLTLETEPLTVGGLVQGVVESFRPTADAKAIVLTCEDTSAGALVNGSPTRLEQVVGNLLLNALKFTTEGGRVDTRVRGANGWIEVEVADTGEGIAPEFLPHVFDRFRQADASSTRAHTGLGLGLAIVRELVHLHRGEVAVDSSGPGRGAAFTVRLPILTGEAAAIQRSGTGEVRAVHEPVALTGIKVLAVDDEPSAREILAEILLACGASVTVAGSVHEALRAFKLGPPDVVVTDIAMPGQDGYDLVDRIRRLGGDGARTPIVALTAFASVQDREKALARGFDRYLAKPLDAVRVSAVVAELVSQRVLPRGTSDE
jgi:PAS domain S-box-containing protein